MAWVVCKRCRKRDKPDTTVIPHNVGTSQKMICPYCAFDTKYAALCRACCLTGHGTHPERRNPQ